MAEPDWNPDTGGRSLAEILREAGIESAARTARRRRVDDDDTGIRQRRADDAAAADRAGYGRRSSDLQVSEAAPARERRSPRRTAPDPVRARALAALSLGATSPLGDAVEGEEIH